MVHYHTRDSCFCQSSPVLRKSCALTSSDTSDIKSWGGREEPYFVFPVFSGKTTEVELGFAVLEVGVLKPDGSANIHADVELAIETKDVAGSLLYDVVTSAPRSTDERGIATFVVTEGIYAAHGGSDLYGY